jgi:hypothetical protein
MRVSPVAALLLLVQLPLRAQSSELRGGITDPQGQTIAGATVHLGDAFATSASSICNFCSSLPKSKVS